MLFSVIIPVYNAEKYILQCLDSVTSQIMKCYEIVLVNDGSTDQSMEIIESYAKQHPEENLRIINKENEGPISARLRGLEESSGEYVLFIDADDLLGDNYFKTLANAIDEYNRPDMVLFNYCEIDKNGNVRKTHEPLYQLSRVKKELIVEKLLKSNDINTVWIKCIKREVIARIDYPIKYRKIKMGEDIFISTPIVFTSNSFVYLDKALYKYRKTEDSITSHISKVHFFEAMAVREFIYDYVSDKSPQYLDMVYNRFFHIFTGYLSKLVQQYSKQEYTDIYKDATMLNIFILMMDHYKEIKLINRLRFYAVNPKYYGILKLLMKIHR